MIKEQIVTGADPVKGRRLSILPSGFGVQIAVEQYVVSAFAAGVTLRLNALRRETITENFENFLFTDITFLVGDISEALAENQLNRVNLIAKFGGIAFLAEACSSSYANIERRRSNV